MPKHCDNCGAHVQAAYHRTFSVDGVLYACLNCSPKCSSRHPDSAGVTRVKWDRETPGN